MAAQNAARATSEVIILSSGVAVAAADSKEVVSSYLVNGNTVADARDVCKVRRVGSSVALAAGFLRANDFYALDAIRELARDGQSLDELSATVMEALPARMAPALAAARKAGDETLVERCRTRTRSRWRSSGCAMARPR